ncbi:Ran-binding protein 3, partial [Dufourea novaeangliae]
ESNEETNRPSYILKVDPPQEPSTESSKNATSEKMDIPPTDNDTEESSSSSNKSPTKPHYPMLAASKFGNQFGSNDFTKSFANKRKTSILRPSQLGAVTNKKETKTEEKPAEDTQCRFLPLGVSTKDNESNNVDNAVGPCTSAPSFVFACRPTTRPGLTLTQAAQELEEANRANKRKYSEVTPLTGEEGETNVLQINCKLFAFDKASGGWQERGRGTLRLNDRDDEESRLVGRTAGTQRLILNTKVWPGMTAERPAPKSLRLTAMDVHGDIRIFIVQAAPKEIEQLHNLLQQRLKRAQERQPKKVAADH